MSSLRSILRRPQSGEFLRRHIRRRSHTRSHDSSQPVVLISNLIPFLGDTILYLPLIDAIRANWPDAYIIYLSDSSVEPILHSYPGIDESVSYRGLASHSIIKHIPVLRSFFRMASLYSHFKSVHFQKPPDLALVPRGGVDPFFSAHAAWLLNVPRIYGYSSFLEPERLSMGRDADALFDRAVENKHHLHESMRALEVAEIAGLLDSDCWSYLSPIRGLKDLAEAQSNEEIAQIAGLRPRESYAVIAPGASAARRRWPVERFSEIADLLVTHTGLSVLVTGTAHEHTLGEQLRGENGQRIRNLAGKLNLLQLISLLNKASLFVGNDSGTGHIAGALGLPTISINSYPKSARDDHPQSPTRTRPIGPRVWVVSPDNFLAPCTEECISDRAHCVSQISAEMVWGAVAQALRVI